MSELLAHSDTAGPGKLEERITQAVRDESCARRAVWVMVLSTALAAAGIGYAAVFLWDYPGNISQFVTYSSVQMFGVLGLASLISLVAFACVHAHCRKVVGQRRKECGRNAAELAGTSRSEPAHFGATSSQAARLPGCGAAEGRSVRATSTQAIELSEL